MKWIKSMFENKYAQSNSYKTTGQSMDEVQLIYSLIRWVSMKSIRAIGQIMSWMHTLHIQFDINNNY